MSRKEIEDRIKLWVIKVLEVCATLPKTEGSRVFKYQLIKSSTSTGANYRAAGRVRSLADMINKLKITEEECDESM